ncbi:hypothetical protein DFS34DRAFT_9749 [Phlyctochytrium arcticum]|nr:hypothetical protein DFS34DRAFT_9749 [Phlyctochytrium arcticum]
MSSPVSRSRGSRRGKADGTSNGKSRREAKATGRSPANFREGNDTDWSQSKVQRTSSPIVLERRPANSASRLENVQPKLLLRNPQVVAVPSSIQIQRKEGGHEDTVLTSSNVHPSLLPRVHQFLDRQLRTQSLDTVHQALSDGPGTFVIGAIGRRGVGKSTILSSFALTADVFPMGPSVQSDGVCLHVTGDGVILLDSQPLALPGSRTSPEDAAQTMRMVTLMMSICHVLLIVTDSDEPDTELLRFLRHMEAMRHRIISNLHEEQHADHGKPELVYVNTKCLGPAFQEQNYETLATALRSWFKGTRAGVCGGDIDIEQALGRHDAGPSLQTVLGPVVDDFGGTTKSSLSSMSVDTSASGRLQRQSLSTGSIRSDTLAPLKQDRRSHGRANIFLLPFLRPNVPTAESATSPRTLLRQRLVGARIPASFEFLVKRLRDQIFAISRYSKVDNRGPPLMLRHYAVSEREWLKTTLKSWEAIRKADMWKLWSKVIKDATPHDGS